MGAMRNLIRKLVPQKWLDTYRARKRVAKRKDLEKQAQKGGTISEENLKTDLHKMGIVSGDVLMVHSAMSAIGFLENGPKTFVDALFCVLGAGGTLCMPSSPVKTLQLLHMQQQPIFDVKNTPSAMGAISEYFRKLPNTVRSLHPTEPVCANGPKAQDIVSQHFGQITPYGQDAPWRKIMEENGKILYVGVTLINAGTHLHTLEDAVNFAYPIYADQIFEAKIIDENGQQKIMKTKVHNPEYSAKRRCDALIPIFEREGVLQHTRLGQADCLLLDAQKMFAVMVRLYTENGVTMYHPKGKEN